jgi:arylsulfatase A-like enzyme
MTLDTHAALPRRTILAGLAASVAAAEIQARASGLEKPNILWLVSEDNNPFVGAYGDRLAHTPTIDALASKGLLYRNVYSNAPVCAPSRFAILTGIYPESCAPANQMRAVAKLPPAFKTYPELLRRAGYFCTNNAKTDYNCDVDPARIWDVQGPTGHWRHRAEGQPFMAVFNHETTHESQIFTPRPGRVTPDMIRVPPYLPDTDGVRENFASYYNLMEMMDGQLALRLAELEADGLSQDTIVFHYSDNGGVLGRSKRYCYDAGLRCEMVIYVPPKWRHLMPAAPGSEIKSPVSLVDLAPTLLALAGVPQPPQMAGRTFLGAGAAPQRYAFGMRNRMDERIDFQRSVTDGRWRYIRNYMPHRPWGQHQAFAWLAKGYQDWEAAHLAGTLDPVQDRFFQRKSFEELYDLRTDPHELHNLAGAKATTSKLRAMRKVLDHHMLAVRDNGFLPETMEGEGFYESRDDERYPLRQVMAIAAVAARGDPADIRRLAVGLTSEAAVVRYWAATGFLIRGPASLSARTQLLTCMRTDNAPMVRIVAAEAAAALGDAEEAIDLLAGMIDEAATWQVQLYALNALTYLGDGARRAMSTVRKAAESEQEYVRNAGRYLAAVLEGRYTPSLPIFDLRRMMAKA